MLNIPRTMCVRGIFCVLLTAECPGVIGEAPEIVEKCPEIIGSVSNVV
jgi:hypothetical protein